jgi:glycosyltransferase involved in cell wall biosynthesis
MAESSIWVVVPAYNEEKVIGGVLKELVDCNPAFNVVVVDDGSKDGTAAEAARLRQVHLLHHPVNLGQGAALATGFEYALGQGAGIVITFDADGQMNPSDINKMVAKIKEGFDVVLGSRFLNVQPVGMPALRKFLLRLAVIFTRVTGRLKVTDMHNGLRAFRADALRKIVITQNQMAHASEILSEISRNRLKYCEVPVGIRYTDYSKAKGQSIFNSINIMYELLTGAKK